MISLPDTKRRKDRPQYIIRQHLPGDFTQVKQGLAEVFSQQIAGESGAQSPVYQRHGLIGLQKGFLVSRIGYDGLVGAHTVGLHLAEQGLFQFVQSGSQLGSEYQRSLFRC
jgi:hypothetical protein